MGGWGGGSKNDPPLFGPKIMNLLVFFDVEPKKYFRVPTPMGFVSRGFGRAFMLFMHFSAVFGMLAGLATKVTPWYPL